MIASAIVGAVVVVVVAAIAIAITIATDCGVIGINAIGISLKPNKSTQFDCKIDVIRNSNSSIFIIQVGQDTCGGLNHRLVGRSDDSRGSLLLLFEEDADEEEPGGYPPPATFTSRISVVLSNTSLSKGWDDTTDSSFFFFINLMYEERTEPKPISGPKCEESRP